MNKKELMKRIVERVGQYEGIRLVLEAYNSEILSNRLSRMETEPTGIRRTEKRDLLLHALQRVAEIVELL